MKSLDLNGQSKETKMCFVVFVLLFVCFSAESKAGMMAAFVVKVFQDLFV